MYAAHAFLPAIIVLLAARLSGLDRRRTLAVGAIAAGFGLLPDVDLVYTLYAVARSGPTGIFPTTEHVWTESWVVHRTLTHSWPVGAVVVLVATAVAVALRSSDATLARTSGATLARTSDARPSRGRTIAATTIALVGATGLLALAFDADGALGTVTVALYVAGAAALARFGAHRGVPAPWLALAAATGVASHPPGDLWMGRPPAALYPLTTETLPAVRFAADPTLHFVAAVLVEVALLCGALAALQVARDRPLSAVASGWSALGALQLLALVLVEPPTFVVAYRFSTLLLGVAAVAAALATATRRRAPRSTVDRALRAVGTGAVASLVGLLAYAVGYVAVT